MLLLFGTRRTTRQLGQAVHPCGRCRQQTWWRYVKSSQTFTLFFIPLIPLGSDTRAVCAGCGFVQHVPEAQAQIALMAARQVQMLPPRG